MAEVSGAKVLASVALLVAVVTGATGCGSARSDGAGEAAQGFYAALSHKDASAACADLALRTRSQLEKTEKSACAKTILTEDLPRVGAPTKVEVFGAMAKVTYRNESAFLSRYSGGWRIVAAGCKPAVGQPYDCQIEGS